MRVQNRDELVALLSPLFASQPLSHWQALFERAQIPMAAINSVQQAIEHPVAERMRIEVDKVAMLASPMRFSATPTRYERAPPQLDAHRGEILAELGLAP